MAIYEWGPRIGVRFIPMLPMIEEAELPTGEEAKKEIVFNINRGYSVDE